MAYLSLKISLEGGRVTKTIQFEPETSVFDACKIIRDKFADAVQGQPSEYGLFLSDEDKTQGVWLESARNLGYYLLRNQDVLEYRRKLRTLRVRMLDGAVKTILVDDSQPVSQLMVVICTKIGITNHEEYGLVREDNESQNENLPDNKSGTLTLRKKIIEKTRGDEKMESLRKKLKTDDEINWVDVGKTLREQNIDEAETVLLRRKFFYSDQNIDSRDPVQLNLLYVQARDAILDGTHPVTQDKACEFAGIQAHIQFGDYNEQKHKQGFLDLKEFLPQSYSRVKNIEKKVFNEQRRHVGSSEIDAKVKYTKTARELPTYGVTFFLVKEKMPGKNKLVPRLLGVTKDSVLRLDEHTKEILRTWPLTTVRRWGASPNTFTLDFGDYADQYYSVQTTEAEQIVQLIAGYIDIILKKKQNKDHFGIEGDEGSTMVEESVAPSKATYLQHETNKIGKINTESLAMPVIIRGSDGERSYTHGDMQSVQYGAVIGQVNVAHQPPTIKEARISSVLSEPQRALLGYISSGQDALSRAESDLMTKAPIPDLGSDAHSIQWRENTLDTSKQAVTTHIATMNAATAQVVTASQPDDMDHEAVGAAVSQIAQSIPEVTKEVRLIAALMEDDNNGDKLLETARTLCTALSDLLKAAEPESKEPRQSLLNAASRVGEASGQVLYTIGEETQENRELQDMLLALAKAVANTTAALVLRAKSVAGECDDEFMRNKVIGAASQCALATSQLVACAKVVAPTLQNAACRGQLEAAAREVANAVTQLVGICNQATDNPQLKGDLLAAAKDVSRTLTDLLDHIKLSAREHAKRVSEEPSPVESVLVATDLLVSSTDPQEMVRQARALGQATAYLIQSIKGEAEQEQRDSDLQRRLLSAAKQLADATAKLVEAARLCAGNPNETAHHEALRIAAEELRDITTTKAHTPAIKRKLINRLEYCAKQAASSATECISAARNAVEYSDDRQTKEQLLQDCGAAAESIPRLINGLKFSLQNPDDASGQLGLIEASEQFVEPGSHVASSARAFHPTVSEHTAAQQLSRSALNLSQSINELGSAAARAREACGGQELESALEAISNLRSVLNDTRKASQENKLRPLPGENAEQSSQQLCNSAKGVGIAMSQLLSAVSQGERMYAGVAGRDTALALGEFTKSVRGVVATGGNPDVIHCADEVIMSSIRLVEEAQRTLQNLGDPQMLTFSARDLTTSLSKCVECLPGQREVDDALKNVSEFNEIINMGEFPPSDKSYSQLQNELKSAAENLNEAGGEVAKAYNSPAWLATVSQNYSVVYRDLLHAALEMAGQTQDQTAQNQMVNGLRGVSVTSISLLSTAKSIASDPTQPNAKNQLSSAARSVTESINYLVNVTTQAAPGQKECDSAIRSIEALRNLLDYPQESYNDQGYYDCVDTATEKSRSLGYAISGMINNAKQSQHVEFGHAVNQVTESIQGLIQSSAQAGYLIGVSHSVGGSARPGIIDQSKLARAYQGTRQSCDIVASPNTTKQQKITALTVIAKHTSYLCSVCRKASINTTNPVAKNEFIEGAKLVANTTSDLVQEVKGLNDDYSAPSRAKFVEPLLDAVNSLCQYASSPEFLSVPIQITAEGRKAQEPILQAGRGVLDGVIEMVRAAKSLAVSPDDPPVWQQLASHSKPVSDSVKKLVDNIRDKAPGQAQCDQVMETLSNCARELDSASMAIGVQGLPKRTDNTLQGFTEQTLNSSAELLDKLEPIKLAAKRSAENLGHAVGEISRYVVPMTSGAIGACTHVVHSSQQIVFIDQTKSVVECAKELVQLSKAAGGNPRATQLHPQIDEAVSSLREAILELNATIEKLSTESGVVTRLMEQISRSISRISDKRQSLMATSMSDTFVDYQTRMVQNSKMIARLANEMNAKAALDPTKLAQISSDITQHYVQLAQDSVGASYTTSSPESSTRIKSSVLDLGRSVGMIIKAGNGLRADDVAGQNEVGKSAKDISEKVSQVLAALQAGSRGTQACINAASTVSGVIGDLDTTIMFATAGTLNSDDNASFGDHREHILKTAKALVEDTKILVAGAAGSQDQLAAAAQNAVSTILQLADAVKRGACSLTSAQPDSQVMVINAVKDVAAALGALINATKLASGKSINDPAMQDLKESARINKIIQNSSTINYSSDTDWWVSDQEEELQRIPATPTFDLVISEQYQQRQASPPQPPPRQSSVMVLNVSSLLKTVKAVEDEHTRGTRAMEATVEAISQEIRAMTTPLQPGSVPATPEDLMRVTKAVTNATAKAVAAGASNQQTDIVAAANLGRRAISEMLVVCKSVAWSCAETFDLRQRTLDAGGAVAISYRDLLQGVLKGCTADERMHLSRRVAKCVTDLVAMAQLLKGSDWIDPDDPTVIAENELLGAAASIDAAAKKLANLRPRQQADVKEADSNMQFDEMILEAARGIMAASSGLVRAANAAQRELIDQGKVSRTPLTSSDDGQWSEGLISAARLVAAATHSLVESAQNLVQGVGTEEMLISSAKQVAASTAQLLIACKVKSDPNSETGRRLQAAGNAVIKSTDNLVRAAQRAIDMEEEHIIRINTSMVDGMAQEINARSEVIKMEKRLEEARNKLVAIRQAKYRHKVNTTDESGGESDGYQQYYQQGPPPPPPPSYHISPHHQQHYHIAGGGISGGATTTAGSINRSLNATPPSPSFLNTSTSTQYQQQQQQSQSSNSTSPRMPQRSHILTANAIPRPYQPLSETGLSGVNSLPQSPILNRSFQLSSSNNVQQSSSVPQSPTLNRSFVSQIPKATTTIQPPPPPPPVVPVKPNQYQRLGNGAGSNGNINVVYRNQQQQQPGQVDDFVQELHTRTFGSSSQQQQQQNGDTTTSNKSGLQTFNGGPNNDGYTRYESSSTTSNVVYPTQEFSTMTLQNDGSGSTRLASMTQRQMERRTVTTTSETRSEKKSQQHSYRLGG